MARAPLTHILRSQQFDQNFLDTILPMAAEIKARHKENKWIFRHRLKDISVLLLFYEPSTRTEKSFDQACRFLGTIPSTTQNAGVFSSAAKGETLEDSIEILCGYGYDFIILRHPEEGASERAAKVASKHGVSIINAGDGAGQHPTQALLDIFTIWEKFGRLKNLTITLGGDLFHGRTVHSLIYLLSKFKNICFHFVAPKELQLRPDIIDYLTRHKKERRLSWTFEDALSKKILKETDVLYWTRIQKERMAGNGEHLKNFVLTPQIVKSLPKESIIMHPLPRVGEIHPSVDRDPRAWYFKQAKNGLFVRMALLSYLFHDH